MRYDYECINGHTFEVEQPMESKADSCPDCGSKDIWKLISKPMIDLKGTGFYKGGLQ